MADKPEVQFIPIDAVEGAEATRAYLLEHGWTGDGAKLRWQGAGKRTVTEARHEHRGREVDAAADRVHATDDPLLLRRAFRSGERHLSATALANPHVPASLVQEAFADGRYAQVAASPGLSPELQQAMLPTLLQEGRAQAEKPYAGSQDIVMALVGNPRVPLDVRLDLVADSFRWLRPHGAVDAAVDSTDPNLLSAVTADLLDRYRAMPVHELERRRDLEALLDTVAANTAAPVDAFDGITALEHPELDETLCGNPMLPARLYQRLSPLCEQRYRGHTSMRAIAAVPQQGWRPHTDMTRWRRLWWERGSGRNLMAEPEGGTVDVAELPDGDLVVCGAELERRYVDEEYGPLLWVRVAWPRSPTPLRYRGFGHGVTVAEAGPFLRRAGAAVLAAWPDIRSEWVAHHPEAVLATAQLQELAVNERVWDAAAEAVAAGMDVRVAARRLGVKVAELRDDVQHRSVRERPAVTVPHHDMSAPAVVSYEKDAYLPAVRVTLPDDGDAKE